MHALRGPQAQQHRALACQPRRQPRPRCGPPRATAQQQQQQPQQQQQRLRLRRATPDDAEAVGQLYAEVFGSGLFLGSGFESMELLQQLEGRYSDAVVRETKSSLAEALENKSRAAVEARTYRLARQAALLRAQLASAQGLPTTWPTEGPAELRQLSKWRRARRFVCLVVEQPPPPGKLDGGGGGQPQLVGTATLSMRQAEAALPPPFPSGARYRPYISNMAVAPGHRRRGVARALVGAAARVAAAWGEPSLLLHVAADNGAARGLYAACGFSPAAGGGGGGALGGLLPRGPWTQVRMVGDPRRVAADCSRAVGAGVGAGGGG